jgi:hypothetical protein
MEHAIISVSTKVTEIQISLKVISDKISTQSLAQAESIIDQAADRRIWTSVWPAG